MSGVQGIEDLMMARPQLNVDALIEYLRETAATALMVYALIDDEPGDRFLLGVFLTKEGAEREAGDWPGACHIELLELEL